ncbi:GNAT family N-acetyltransferase [Deinococcus frigens]|uniref:GNAT family N-acetyltransferase n=1 Tax=Deinococcus frigens TaxID=249403 RepID=UPI000A97584C|nr:GNAT family N-acetyltransferase [Deinococcus frigens]
MRPPARRQGHGTTLLRLTLERARELGLGRVLLTCDADNLSSRGVTEGNGGILEGELVVYLHGRCVRRSWTTF